ncbi:hypothetical protein M569_12574, partial [Genlisea aurea]
LTHKFVLTALHCCPSDLAALSFFLWCARQPHYFHEKPAFHHMATVISSLTRTYRSVEGIIQALETVGCIRKAQTLLLLMRIYWHADMFEMVFEAFDGMINYGYIPNTYARNIVMDALFKIRQAGMALTVLEETKSPNFLSFNIAVTNLCRINDLDNVKRVVRLMLSKGYYPNLETYVLIMNCLRNCSSFRETLQLLGMMSVLGAPLCTRIWSILIDCACKSRRLDVAAFLLEKMVGIGFSPNMAACTSLIKGHLESHMPAKAFEILGILESKGCAPDLVLCNVLIDCLSKMGWYRDALLVFSGLRERRMAPDAYTYSSLISTVCLSRQYVLLPLLTSNLLIVQPDLVVCNGLLSYFCKACYPEGAVEFYRDMTESGFVPDKYSFAGLLTALCALGRVREAAKVYRGIVLSDADVDDHVHTIMMYGLVRGGYSDEALRLYRKVVAAEKFPL